MPSISGVMPAYNEEANIGPMIEEMDRVLSSVSEDYEIIVVDDGSKDNTAKVVMEKAASFPKVRLIRHERNKGYGAAVYSGITAATKELIFFTDSDRQFKLEELRKLLPLIEHADLVAGYRPRRMDPWYRVLFGWGWSLLVTVLFGYTVRDIDCAFKLFKREVMEKVAPQIRSFGATFSAEFLIRAKRAGFKFKEVPVTHLPRPAGKQTGARLDVIARAFKELFILRWRLWKEALGRSEAR
jgi:glycosyltransferase involved in cell wall biosynthesis